MKKHKLPKDSFIGGYYINKKLCDYFITSFNKQRDRAGPGKINSKVGPREIDKSNKLLSHSSDALGYAVTYEFPVHKPKLWSINR